MSSRVRRAGSALPLSRLRMGRRCCGKDDPAAGADGHPPGRTRDGGCLPGRPRRVARHPAPADEPRPVERRGVGGIRFRGARAGGRALRGDLGARRLCDRRRWHRVRPPPRGGGGAQRGTDCGPAEMRPGPSRPGHGARRWADDGRGVGGFRRRAPRHDRHEPRARDRPRGADRAHPGRDLLAQPRRGAAPGEPRLPFGAAQPDLLGGRVARRGRDRRQLAAPRV